MDLLFLDTHAILYRGAGVPSMAAFLPPAFPACFLSACTASASASLFSARWEVDWEVGVALLCAPLFGGGREDIPLGFLPLTFHSQWVLQTSLLEEGGGIYVAPPVTLTASTLLAVLMGGHSVGSHMTLLPVSSCAGICVRDPTWTSDKQLNVYLCALLSSSRLPACKCICL